MNKQSLLLSYYVVVENVKFVYQNFMKVVYAAIGQLSIDYIVDKESRSGFRKKGKD